MPEVRKERTGWRDLALSERHRLWGWNLPAVDLDFLFLEYDRGKAVALVEYKHVRASPQNSIHPTYQAMIDLGNRAGIPVIACRYQNDFTRWTITPLNVAAKKWVPQQTVLDERGWVTLLYKIRGYDVPPELFTDGHLKL
jgi:hypothetical protein